MCYIVLIAIKIERLENHFRNSASNDVLWHLLKVVLSTVTDMNGGRSGIEISCIYII